MQEHGDLSWFGPPESNNPTSSLVVLLCGFLLIILVALYRLQAATFIVWKTGS
jgi:hypothetical protein